MILKIQLNIQVLVLFLLFISNPAKSPGSELVVKTDLTGEWLFSEAGLNNWKSAYVPGSVHTDLRNHDMIPDPFYRYNEDSVKWVEERDWVYRKSFQVDQNLIGKAHIDLVFKGLDTYADIFLNGEQIYSADNMFIEHRVDVRKWIKAGENELKIRFYSAVRRNTEKASRLPYHLKILNENEPDSLRTRPFSRKAPFHFGWDWGPRLVTCGIWRPVYIEAWDDVRLIDVYLKPGTISSELACYEAEFEIITDRSFDVTLTINIPQTNVNESKKIQLKTGGNQVCMPFEIRNPELWWPNGLGDAHLYTVDITMNYKGKTDHLQRPLGVRTIKLVQEPDSVGRTFYFEVNGIPVFIKGANYIPSETVTTQISPAVYQRVIDDAVKANMNMLRVWGGAIYEDDYFYNLCDSNGLLVWQDFLFACELNPGDPAHIENIRKEAAYNVKRLRNHPSIALWCGNNENLHGWYKWGWKEAYPQDISDFLFKTYETIFHKILPDAVNTNHPEIEYWASSPGSYPGGRVLADRKSGDEHDWNVWFGPVVPFEEYETNVPRFVSEYGLQSYPEMRTWQGIAEPAELEYRSGFLTWKQRSRMDWLEPGWDGNRMILEYIRKYFGEPDGFESYVYLSQVTHALGLQTGIEIHRRNRPRCMGTMYWQLNDCWPTMSWATVDYFGRWKASHYAVREAYETVIISAKKVRDGLDIFVVSDSTNHIDGELHITITDFDGKPIKSLNKKLNIPALSSQKALHLSGENLDVHKNLVSIELYAAGKVIAEKIALFRHHPDVQLNEPNLSIETSKERKILKVTVSCDSYAPGVYLQSAEEGWFSDNFFDLMPGSSKEIYFQPAHQPEHIRNVTFSVSALQHHLKKYK